jgi:regulator of replication initiation timing
MDAPTLMNKLMEIERALSRHDECAVRNLILQAQDGVLTLEQENETLAIENAGLRQRLDDYRRSPRKLLALKSTSVGSRALPAEAAAPLTLADDSPADPQTPVWHTTHFFFT